MSDVITISESADSLCSLDEGQRKDRREELQSVFTPHVRSARELEDGIVFGFDASRETAQVVADFVAFEQDCCSSARYTVERRGETILLEIRGPEGTAELLRLIVPPTVPVEREPTGAQATGSFRFGATGAAASVVALLFCATPALPFVLGALGVTASLGAVGWWVDALAVPALVVSAGCMGFAVYKRRVAKPATVPSSDCGC
jgi:hypothetical protein